MRARLGLASFVLASVAGAAALALAMRGSHERPAEPIAAKSAPHQPSIFCEFYDFMHKTIVASFDFAVEERPSPALMLRARASSDGAVTNLGEGDRPRWTFAVEDGTPAAIAPDGETRIIFYGLKPEQGGVTWSEAGVRNVSIRNLEGRCRQAYLDQTKLGAAATGSRREDMQR